MKHEVVANQMFFYCEYLGTLHIPLYQMTGESKKLDDKSQKCIFIGYSEVTKGYKLYNLVTKEVIVSRDVQFIEDGMDMD